MIADVCAKYPGSVLLFERLRKIKRGGGSKSRRMNRRQANHLRGKINHYAKDKNYAQGLVTVEVNPHGTSQYCSVLRCQEGEVLLPEWRVGQRKVGQGLPMSGVSL